MRKQNRLVTALALTAMLMTSLPVTAGIVGTEQMMTQGARAQALDRIESILASEAVAAQFEAWGVESGVVKARIAAMSDLELQQLAAEMETAPAGGVLVVVGAVFVVLLVLEVIGVTNIFRRV